MVILFNFICYCEDFLSQTQRSNSSDKICDQETMLWTWFNVRGLRKVACLGERIQHGFSGNKASHMVNDQMATCTK